MPNRADRRTLIFGRNYAAQIETIVVVRDNAMTAEEWQPSAADVHLTGSSMPNQSS